MPGIASSSPAVLLAHVASATSTIRIGSGGVMLPNHAPLVVAEQFGMLEALHPGRVDLGIGRRPGHRPGHGEGPAPLGQPLHRGGVPRAAQRAPRLLRRRLPRRPPLSQHHRGAGARATDPRCGSWDRATTAPTPPACSGCRSPSPTTSRPANTLPALAAYRASFRPSEDLARPYAMLGVAVVCADTDEQASWLAGPSALAIVRLRSGRPGVYPTPEEAAAYPFTEVERQVARSWTASHIIGSPDTVRRQLGELVERTGADELMVTTMVHGPADRARSYQLLAEAVGLQPASSQRLPHAPERPAPSQRGHVDEDRVPARRAVGDDVGLLLGLQVAVGVGRPHPEPVGARRGLPSRWPTAARRRWWARRPGGPPARRLVDLDLDLGDAAVLGPGHAGDRRPARPQAASRLAGVSMRRHGLDRALDGPAPPDPVGVEGVEGRQLQLGHPLGRRDVAVQPGHDHAAPGSRATTAAARRSCRRRAGRRARRATTAVGVPTRPPVVPTAHELVGARLRRRPRRAASASGRPASGRCRSSSPPTSFDTQARVTTRSTIGRASRSSKVSVELAVHHPVDPQPPHAR